MPDRITRAAVWYAERLHWPIFPLHPITATGKCAGCGNQACAGKHPISTHWQNTLPSVKAARSAWRPELGPRGIGLPCGPRAGVWVLDIDAGKGGDAAFADLVANHTPLPETWHAQSGGGGHHYYFAAVDDSVRNSTSQLAVGVDVRGAGGYIVLPPSLHRSGNRYEWDVAPTTTPLAVAPDWLTTLASRNDKSPANGHYAPFADPVDRIPAGRRHEALVRFCGLLRSGGLCEEAIVECGLSFLRHHVTDNPPMDLTHAEKTMRDIARRYPPTAPASLHAAA